MMMNDGQTEWFIFNKPVGNHPEMSYYEALQTKNNKYRNVISA